MAADRTRVIRITSKVLRLWLLATLASVWVAAGAPEKLPGRVTMKVYTSRDGLPQDSILALALDQQSRLWAGTMHGIARYDGHGWTAIETPVPSASLHVNLNSMACLADGSIWIGTRNQGLLVHREGRWTRFLSTDGLPSGNVNAVLESEARGADGRRIVWIGSYDAGLARWENGRFAPLPPEDDLRGQRIFALLEIPRGGERELWAATDQGLFCRTRAGWRPFHLNARLPGRRVRCLAALPSAAGVELWAGLEEGGIATWDGNSLGVFGPKLGLPPGPVYSLLVGGGIAQQRKVWAAVNGSGLACFENGRWSLLGLKDGLPTTQLRTLAEVWAPSGPRVLWLGTDGRGMLRWQEGGWRSLLFPDPEADRRVVPIVATGTGNGAAFWFGTQTGGIWSLAAGRWRKWTRKEGLPSDAVRDLRSLQFQGKRELWAATNAGLARLVDGRWRRFGPPLDSLTVTTRRILDTHGSEGDRVWIATSRGLLEWDGSSWIEHRREPGMPGDSVRCMTADQDRSGATRLWAGTDQGLAYRLDGVWHPVPLEGIGDTPGISALAWFRGPDGRPLLAVGVYGGGFTLLDVSGRSTYLRIPMFANRPISLWDAVVAVAQDRQGRIYIGTLRGVHRLTLVAAGEARLESFVEEDGLPSLECTQTDPLVDPQGRVWIGTVGGPACLDPGEERIDQSPKSLLFRRAAAEGIQEPLRSGQELPPAPRSVTFEYVLVSHYREADCRYRTQMVGFESDPTEWSTETLRRYANLPPGAFLFRVWAMDYAGNRSGPLDFQLRVRAPWWATVWARMLGLLAVGFLAWLLFRLRLRVLQRRNELLAEQVEARTREVTAQKEALERLTADLVEQHIQKGEFLRIVAHDLRNPLNHIQLTAELLLEEGPELDPREHLLTIKRSSARMGEILGSILSKEALESGRIQIHPGCVGLADLVAHRIDGFQDQLRLRRMAVELQIPEAIRVQADPDRLGEVLDNLLSNAIKYSPDGTALCLCGTKVGGQVVLEIRDAGVGIPAAELPDLFKPFARLSPVPFHGGSSLGLGLSIVKRLMEAMDGSVRAESELGRGTTMILTLPPWNPDE